MTTEYKQAWERITDETNYLKGTVTYVQQVGESSVFRYVEVSPVYGRTQLVYFSGVVDVDAVSMSPIIEYHEGNVLITDGYKSMVEYILDYYGGERFDRQPFLYDTSRVDDMLQLEFLLKHKGISKGE